MSTGFSPARSPYDHSNPSSHVASVEQLADRAEERLREHLKVEYARQPTDEEVGWVRGYPKRIAEKPDGRDPRPPTISEMRREFGWGASKSEKERWGEDFTEQQTSGPDLHYRKDIKRKPA
jgi:hypothetical protein